MNQTHVQWCRQLFDSIKDGGVWGIPRSGLLFRKVGTEFVLIDRMPHDPAMPITPAELEEQQESEYETNRQHFEAAGVKMRRLV